MSNHLSHVLPAAWNCCEARPAGLIAFPDGGEAMIACAPCLGTVPAYRRLPLPTESTVAAPEAALMGTCGNPTCGAVCTRVFLPTRDALLGICAKCVAAL